MDILNNFLQNNNLKDSDDIDALLECASVVRQLISENSQEALCSLIRYTVENSFYEALLWTAGILQEEFEKETCVLQDFCCDMGSHIADYDKFVQTMEVDFSPVENGIKKVYDENGEVGAFFNVMVYRTTFENVFLISSENFDNKDNDYVQYSLSFVKNKNTYL